MFEGGGRIARYLGMIALLAACRGDADLHAQSEQARAQVREQLGPVTALDTATASRLSNTFRAAADRALPAVVAIQVISAPRVITQRGRAPQQMPEDFRRFFEQFGDQFGLGEPEGLDPSPQQGTGSGFIIDGQGHIMTNHHVVNEATRIMVRTLDGREYEAKLVGSDASTDVAIIKIEPRRGENLPLSTLGDSDQLRVGDWVLALGNPLGFNFTVTAGIVSAKGRQLQRSNEAALEAYIQTDAAINPGNSGGPLVDLFGRVVGMNTAIQGPAFIGYGFSVPIDLARRVADDLMKQGYVRRPRIGVRIQDVTDVDAEVYGLSEVQGAHLVAVEDGQPAAQAGLRPGDVILSLNGRDIKDATDLTTSLARLQPGEQVQLKVWRERRELQVSLRLGEFERATPPTAAAAAEASSMSRLGFQAQAITPQLARDYQISVSEGVVVTSVNRNGPARARGVEPGQVVVSINGVRVRTEEDLERIAGSLATNATVSLRVQDRRLGETVINYRVR